ncbi:MAG: TrkA family potassium uptake protein [Acidimicrobiaceae bacterium]|nr:TrkA family potassium uptake protein [Acidimicrobiaceae bacterium]
MHIIVIGCGRVGSELATRLSEDGHSIAVIDKAERAFRRLPDKFTGQTIVGFGFDRDHLLQAGILHADAVAAVTSGDNSNILSARIAKETFAIKNVVARIYDPRRAVIYQRLGIQTVATVTWTTEQAIRRLIPDSITPEWSDPAGKIFLVERNLPDARCGMKIASLNSKNARVVMVTRANIARLMNPELIGQEGDVLHILIEREAISEFDAKLSSKEPE